MVIMVVLFRPHAFASLCKMVCPCKPSKCVSNPERVCMPVDYLCQPSKGMHASWLCLCKSSKCMYASEYLCKPSKNIYIYMPVDSAFASPARVCMPVDSAFVRPASVYASARFAPGWHQSFHKLNPRRPLKGVKRLVCSDKALSFFIPHVRTGREKKKETGL